MTSGDVVEGAEPPRAPDPECGAADPTNGHTCVLPPGHHRAHRDEEMRGWWSDSTPERH
ncbi:hypothetical protein [Plantactinospora soyae]|uniref:Uncharacterized protein n=1 Tax=Plantactinospora soyae TaxID=1544732 RepID=A0A927LZH6_9ACTN|nr:hypothetical protein [Plantactinospora soyae]MBE1485244.1 hypothetical protein [Plantactinospora soyae]